MKKPFITILILMFIGLSVFAIADAIVQIQPRDPNQFDNLSCNVGGRIREGFSYEWIIGDNVFNQNPLPLNGRFAGQEVICNVYVESPFGSRIVGTDHVPIAPNEAPVINPPLPDVQFVQGSSDSSIILNNHVSDRHTPDNELRWTVEGNRNINVRIDPLRGNLVTFTSDANFRGQEEITFTVDDREGGSVSDNILVTVTRRNEHPQAMIIEPRQDGELLNVGQEFTFAALAADDAGVIRLRWDFGDGERVDSNIAPNRNLRSEAVHTYNIPGRYIVTFFAGDEDGAFGTSSVVVNVIEPAPIDVDIVSPANGQQFFVGDDVEYEFIIRDGSVIENVEWSFGDGARSNEQNPVHAYVAPGEYIIRLTVEGERNREGRDSVRIRVNREVEGNEPPEFTQIRVGNARFCVGEQHQFEADAADPEGEELRFEWVFGDGARSNEQNPVHAYVAPGEYQVTVKVTDEANLEDVANFNVEVENCVDGNEAPTVDITQPAGDLNEFIVGEEIEFRSNFNDDNGIVELVWDFGDGNNDRTRFLAPAVGASLTTHTYNALGRYVVSVVATDEDGAQARDEVVIIILFREDPVAVPKVNGLRAALTCVNQEVELDGSDSFDPDGNIEVYEWDLGDGNIVLGETIRHSYESEGHYQPILTVTDNHGRKNRSVVLIIADLCITKDISGIDRADKPTLTSATVGSKAHRFDIMGINPLNYKNSYSPGENLQFTVNMKNFGPSKEKMYMDVSVSDLGIYERQRGFYINGRSSTSFPVTINIPRDAVSGWHSARIYLNNGKGDSSVRFWPFYVN